LPYKTVQEIAKEFGVNEITVKRMIYSKKIKAIKIGNSWRIPNEEFERIKKEGVANER
jgi:excisionase family DNA binding protein